MQTNDIERTDGQNYMKPAELGYFLEQRRVPPCPLLHTPIIIIEVFMILHRK